jgi:hypothetical protein
LDGEGYCRASRHERSVGGHLRDALCRSYEVLGFEQATSGDEVFRQLVLARIIEPASKLGSRVLDLRRRFSNVTPTAKSLVKRLLQRIGKTGQVRTDPKFEDARGPNVRELRCVQRRLSPAEVEGLLADYEAGGWVGELPRTYGIHRTTVSAHIARTGKTRPRGRVAAETLDS